jgi:mRNA-degrading endonuclease RelE of RelBE toxin-antitoxin system
MEFFEAPSFTRHLQEYLTEDKYRALQSQLAEHPELGDMMPGAGGFRKLRWADQRRRKGRRGGLRVIYYHFAVDQQIWLMTLYDKSEAADLTKAEKKTLQNAIAAEVRARAARKKRGH